MASPNRDKQKPGGGKVYKDDDTTLDVSAILAKLDSVLSATTGLKVNADINVGDIEIGAVELKDGSTDTRGTVNAANTARTNATTTVVTQPIDAAGNVLGRDAANTARTTATLVNPVQVIDAAGTVATNITAGADAVSNTATRLGVSAWLKAFNGTTWDRVRSGDTTVSSTFTGKVNILPWAIFNTTPTTRTNGQGGPLQSDANGNLLVTLGTKIRGEDETNDVMKIEQQFTSSFISTATTTTSKSGVGRLHTINILKTLVGAVDVYDNTAGSGTKLASFAAGTTPTSFTFNVAFATGLTTVTASADTLALSYR